MSDSSHHHHLHFHSLRKLKHEIGNDLSVIKMGLEALVGVRESPDEFAEIIGMMRENVKSLKDNVATLVDQSMLVTADEGRPTSD